MYVLRMYPGVAEANSAIRSGPPKVVPKYCTSGISTRNDITPPASITPAIRGPMM
jgi:hypothetical protein